MVPISDKSRIQALLDKIVLAVPDLSLPAAADSRQTDPLTRLSEAVDGLLQKNASASTTKEFLSPTDKTGENRLQKILDRMQESYFEADLQGHILFVNDRVVRALGYRADELYGMRFSRLMDEQNARNVFDVFHNVFITGQAVPAVECRLIGKNGQSIDVESSVDLLLNEQEKPVGFFGVARNIASRKQAQRDLRLSEERYRHILDSIEESYFEVDLKGNLVFFNDTVLRDLNYTADEIRNINFRKLVDNDSARKVFDVFHQVYLTGKAVKGFDWEINRKDGGKIDVEASVALIRDEQGTPCGFRGVVRDIRRRKKTERRLRLITENIRDVIWTRDFDLNYTYVSPSIYGMTGFTAEEMLKIPAKSYLSPEQYAYFRQILDQKLREAHQTEDKGPSAVFELEFLRKDGTPFWVEINADFNRDKNGAPFEIVGITREITERKKIEQALRESEKRYRIILENIRESITTLDLDLNYTYQSPSEIHITGYTAEELVKIPIKDMVPPASYTLIEQIVSEEFAREFGGEPIDPHRTRTFEVEVYHKNGGVIWEELSVSFNRDKNGKPFEIMMVGRNITDRKKMEQALRESEKRYRMIVENIHDVVFTVDLNFQFTFISSNRLLLTGYTAEELQAIPIDKLGPPQTMALVYQEFALALEQEKNRQPNDVTGSKTLELEFYHKNGGTVWLELTAAFLRDEQGSPREIIAAVRDITARKRAELALEESEERYRMIVENMQDTIMVLDINTFKYLYQSPSEIRVTGYTPEEIMSIPTEKQATPESYARAVEILSEELRLEASGEPVDPQRSRTFEMEIYRKDGGTVWLEMTASFHRDKTGKPIGILMAGKNITERKKAEEEKEKLEKQLHHAQKMETVGRLAGGVAHDFNNMLNVILGYVELLKIKLPVYHPVFPDILEIEKAAGRSRDLTAQLLAFSRKQIIRPQTVRLDRLIDNSAKTIQRLLGEHIDFRFSAPDHLWSIKFDPLQIEQILINLAVNAHDAMPDGGIFLIETANLRIDEHYCRSHPGLAGGPHVLLTVSDTGCGIEADHLPYIFEPFFTTKDVGKGTGLGLATVYGIVKQNNGYINVYSEPGQGTVFKIYLPRDAEEETEEEPATDRIPPLGYGTVLVVEDDQMVLKMATDMLETLGYRVMASQSPRDVLSAYQKNPPPIDLLITDVIMPEISGRELRDKLVERHPNLKVLFMSGYPSNIIAHHGILEDGVQFIQKPFSLNDLAAKVSRLIPRTKFAP